MKALNYLLPHIQRVPSRIVRDELANEISHRLGIESGGAAAGAAPRRDARARPQQVSAPASARAAPMPSAC